MGEVLLRTLEMLNITYVVVGEEEFKGKSVDFVAPHK